MPKVNIKHPRRSRRLMPSHLQQNSTRKARLQHNDRKLRTNDIIPCPLQRLLPSEIIGDILFGGYLNKSPKQISVVRAVCVQFRSLASSFCTSLNAKPSFLRKRKIAFSTRMLSNILQQFPFLISVDFSYLGETFTDRHLQLLSPLRDQLRVLKLRGTTVGSGGLEDYFGVADTNVWKTYPLPLEELDLSKTLLSDSNRVGGTVIEALGVSAISHGSYNHMQSLSFIHFCIDRRTCHFRLVVQTCYLFSYQCATKSMMQH